MGVYNIFIIMDIPLICVTYLFLEEKWIKIRWRQVSNLESLFRRVVGRDAYNKYPSLFECIYNYLLKEKGLKIHWRETCTHSKIFSKFH